VHTTRSGITFIGYAQNRKSGKPRQIKVLEASKTKGAKMRRRQYANQLNY